MKTPHFKSKLNRGVIALSTLFLSTSAHAADQDQDLGFLSLVKDLWCTVVNPSGPLVPILVGTAVFALAYMLLFGEEKSGLMGMIIKLAFGIAIIVGLGSLLGAVGIDMGCSTTGSNVNIVL